MEKGNNNSTGNVIHTGCRVNSGMSATTQNEIQPVCKRVITAFGQFGKMPERKDELFFGHL